MNPSLIFSYVSRGGIKLEKALKFFKIDVKDKTALDIGASTGGFTDCLLQHAAKKVYAVDVGYGQLHWKLQQDPKVIRVDRVNARYLKKEDFPEETGFDIITVDVSFISLEKIIPAAKELLKENANMITLVKPQFEVGRGRVGGKGVVRKPELHEEVLLKLVSFSRDSGLSPVGLTYSPVKGPEGNIEYFLNLAMDCPGHPTKRLPVDQVRGTVPILEKIKEVVNSAWHDLREER